MPDQQGLSVRRTVRFELILPARIAIAPVHRSAVRLSSSHGGMDGWVDADLVDFSSGGVGLICGVFIPRRVVIRVKVFGIDREGSGPLLEAVARVQRVVMTDRRPAYLLGTAFEQLTEESVRQIEQLVERLDPTMRRAAPQGGSSHA